MGLCRWLSVWNGGATGKCVVAKSRLPVPGDDQLGGIQELGPIQERSGEVRAIEHRLKQIN